MLIIKQLSKTFHHKKILNNISFSVNKGEIALFLGKSGVGKSTLLRIMNNLETVDSGTITLNNIPLDLKQANKNHTVGMLFQQFNLFEHLTVGDNITLALEKVMGKKKKDAIQIARQLLARYDLADKEHCYSNELSGGQKQRVALVRALALQPQIICLDEPTSALDPLLTAQVAQTIQNLSKEGYIVLVSTHDTQLLYQLDCTIHLMEEGTLVQSALSQDFKREPDRYKKIEQFVKGKID